MASSAYQTIVESLNFLSVRLMLDAD